jgi:hypothetical protein
MKMGMLTALSALPAEDTENHHHSTVKKGKGKCPILSWFCPHRTPQTASQSVENLWGRPWSLLWLQERLLIHKEGPL